MAGPLLLVGLVVPHLARGLVGAAHLWVLPISALLGSALLLMADVVGVWSRDLESCRSAS